jgi:cysteine-rich repeat protein/parallel beta-helix repeat protein
MRLPRSIPLAVLLGLVFAEAAEAAVISVPGDHATIQAALNAAGPGDAIEVDSGTYGEKLEFPASGTPGLPITLRAKPGAPTRPVLDGTGVPGANMVLIESKSHVAVVGLEIRNNLGVNDGSGVRVVGSGSGIEIRDNVIHEIRGQHAMGITVYATEPTPISALVIADNEIYDCDPATSEAVAINGNVDGFEIRGNVVRDVDNIGIVMIGGETDIQPSSALVARNGVVRGNTVMRARSSYGGGFAAGIYVDGGRDIVIENNVVTESDLGIEVGAENAGLVAENVVVRNNLIYRNDKAGIAFGGYAASVGRADDNVFRGNTLYDNNRVPAGEGEIWVQHGSGNLVESNLVVAGGPAGENIAIASFEGSSANAFDHNLYYTLDGAPALFQRNGSEHVGLAAWQAGSAEDAGSIAADPLLVDPDAGDFHLTIASPAIGAGDPSYVPALGETDIDGAARRVGAVVDIGADELTCGDGSVNAGEECDDGNLVSGDGCDENCTLTACGNGIATPGTGEQCDDGNSTPADCCSPTCAYESPGSPCDDGAACSIVDVCDGAGACMGDTAPDPFCQSAGSGGAALKMRTGAKSQLAWKWGRGVAGALADLGDPTSGADVTLCVYATGGPGEIVLEAVAPAGGGWRAVGSGGFKYKDGSGYPDGLRSAQLRPGDAGKAKLRVKGKGVGLPFGPLGFGGGSTVYAQLRSSAGGCYGGVYSPPFKRDESGEFQDESD